MRPLVFKVLIPLLLILSCGTGVPRAQEPPGSNHTEDLPTSLAPRQVEVQHVSDDGKIATRLERILASTGWFEETRVKVAEGVVTLDGQAMRKETKEWAGELARNTKDVVAVVNRLRVVDRSPWDFAPAVKNLESLAREMIRSLPMAGFGLLVVIFFFILARGVGRLTRFILGRRVPNPMLQEVGSRTTMILVFVTGLYVALHVVGLSRLAMTVLGGTGVVGLVVGFAFRDIMENFLAGVLISLRNPFRGGDLIEVAGHLGVVQRVTSRGTVLMDLDGNHVQIPNSTIYKSTILNYTANPSRRLSFEVGIGYENLIPGAQEIAMGVIREHASVLQTPEPLVLVDKLAAATVNLKILFWIDGTVFDGHKVKSALMRGVKRAFQDREISMPDDAREIIFPDGVPVRMLEKGAQEKPRSAEPLPTAQRPELSVTAAEGDLTSQAEEIRRQAQQARNPEEGPNLLK